MTNTANHLDTDPPAASSSVYASIAAIAARRPDAIALAADGEQITYGRLVRSARALAVRLRDAGVGLESRVAILMDRSVDLVSALLATLRAGGAYVPIEPKAPASRIRMLVENAGAHCIVTRAVLRERAAEAGVPAIVIDDAAAADADAPAPLGRTAAPCPDGDSLCYVMYTSGTTGEPKGVAVTHTALLNVLRSMRHTPGLTPADALLAITPMTFDIAALEVFLPLITGARLILAPPHSAADGRDLLARLSRENVSVMQATPGTWHLLLDAGWNAPRGFTVLCGGEPLAPELARRLIDAAGHVWNCYGPTETTIWSTIDRLQAAGEPVTVGRPIAKTRVYLLDRGLEPVPIGVTADLYIGGSGLARGYLGRPAQTAASFRPDPFAGPGDRIYVTGDLAKYRADGRVDCRGRRDHQIKLNGRRIELDAIAHVLDTHASVRESVAAVREDPSRGAILAAYVVPRGHEPIVCAELREQLARRLPAYMVPPAIVLLDALPRTPHGKVDRRALPPPSEADFCAREFVPPRTISEQAVARAWSDVLGISAIGLDDDFFDLGGSSLQATRVLAELHASSGVDVSMQVFFDDPRVRALAEHVERALRNGAASPSAPIVRAPEDRRLALAPQQENWWLAEMLTGNINPNNTLFGLRLTGRLQPPALAQAVAGLQLRHEALRTAFHAGEDGHCTLTMPPANACRLSVQTVDLSGLATDARERTRRELLQADNDRPFVLSEPPLCRATLVRLAPRAHLVTFNLPYLVCDGSSVNVMLDDAFAMYTAGVEGRPSTAPGLAFDYVDFASWQREWVAGPAMASQLAWWRERLAPPWPRLLPVTEAADDGDTPFFSIRGVFPFALQPETAIAARRLARRERCTLFATLVAALKSALYERTRQPDVRIGTLAANRSAHGAERVVGLFANTVCLRTSVDGHLSFRELMRRVQASIGDAAAHQDVPFELVARTLELEYGTPRSALFQVMVFWGVATPELTLPGLEASGYRLEDEESVALARNLLDLRIALLDTPEAISGSITYRMSLFTRDEIRTLVAAIERCLTHAERDAAATVDELCEMPVP